MSPIANTRSCPLTRRSGPVSRRPAGPCGRSHWPSPGGPGWPGHPGRPCGQVAGQLLAAGQDEPVRRDLLDLGVQPQVHPAGDELLPCVVAQRRPERGEQRRRLLDQPDVHPVPADVRIRRGQRQVAQVSQRAGQLHPGRAAAHDGQRQFLVGRAQAELLQPGHQPFPQRGRVVQGVQAVAVLGRAADPVERRRHPGGQDQVVIAGLAAVGEPDRPGRGVDAGQVPVPEPGAVLAGEAAQRVGDVAGRQPGRGHLVQQRLERAVDMPVGQGHREPAPGQRADRGKPAEARPDDQHPWFVVCCRHVDIATQRWAR